MSEHVCVCVCIQFPTFPVFALFPRYLTERSQSLCTRIIWRLSRARHWNIFPQRADFGGDEAQVVGVSGSRSPPPPPFQDGNEAGRGWRSGRRLALLCWSDPSTAAEAGRGPSCAAPNVAVNANAINMFVAGPAQLKGENETTEP